LGAYDLNEPDVVSRLERLGTRLKVIIDDERPHGEAHSSETQAEKRLSASAGENNVKGSAVICRRSNRLSAATLKLGDLRSFRAIDDEI